MEKMRMPSISTRYDSPSSVESNAFTFTCRDSVISPPTPIRRPCSDASIVSGKMYVTGAYCSHVYTTGSKWSSCPWLMNTNTSLKWLSVSGVIRCAAGSFFPCRPIQ